MFCNHREVVVAGQKKKLSVTKGIIGGLLLGPIGAVGGAAGLGKTKTMSPAGRESSDSRSPAPSEFECDVMRCYAMLPCLKLPLPCRHGERE